MLELADPAQHILGVLAWLAVLAALHPGLLNVDLMPEDVRQ